MPPAKPVRSAEDRVRTLGFFLLAFAALLIAIHLPYLRLPYHWDELGQFIPASLDLFRDGSWIPHSTVPNIHPPGVMLFLAGVWKIWGYSVLSTRLAMLAVASFGVLLTFLLTIRLTRGSAGAPAFIAVAFLVANPLFYTQAMVAQLDMPAMVLTLLCLLLFLEENYLPCALAGVALVLTKETSLTTPLVLGAWLGFRDKRWRAAACFLLPCFALAGWLMALQRATGHWAGDAGFAEFNLSGALSPVHLLAAVLRRVWYLFFSNGHFIGLIALFQGWRTIKGREWQLAGLVGIAQVSAVTLLGGATLERYLLPVLPILYAAISAAGSLYTAKWRWASHGTMTALLIAGWFWNPPFPFPSENNLSMVEFVRLQEEAAAYLEANAGDQKIASAWPFTDAIRNPDFGYVERPLAAARANGLHLTELADLPRNYGFLVVFSRERSIDGTWLDTPWAHSLLRRYYDDHPQATEEEIRAGLGYVPLLRWERRGQWIQIYIPE